VLLFKFTNLYEQKVISSDQIYNVVSRLYVNLKTLNFRVVAVL